MEDKRTALAIFLCIIFIVAYTETVLKPAPSDVPPQTTQATSTPGTNSQHASNSPVPNLPNQAVTPALTDTQEEVFTPPTLSEVINSPQYLIETDLVKVQISSLGGRITSFKLKQHKKKLDDKSPLELVSVEKGSIYPLSLKVGGYDDSNVNYSVAGATANIPVKDNAYRVTGTKEFTLKLTGQLPNGAELTKSFTFEGHSYLFELKANSSIKTQDDSKIWLGWNQEIDFNDRAEALDPKSFSFLDKQDEFDIEPVLKIEPGLHKASALNWISIGGKYFMATILPLSPDAQTAIIRTDLGDKVETFTITAEGTNKDGSYKIYIGPKEYNSLQDLGYDLHRTINLGIFAFLAHPLMWCLNFFYSFIGNYGLAIILLTLSIKIIFLPLTKASMTSMKAMQDLQPEIKALRERVKDPTQLNQEMMALYKRRGVNPMGGCFPILIQIPVFLGLYNGLLNSIELRHSPFALWINDLSAPERLYILGVPVPVMIIIMGLSMFIQQWTTPSAMDPTQKKVMMLMPVMFTVMFIIFPFPAGLVLYWLVNNVISIIQQVFLRSDRKVTPFGATMIASFAIFCFGYILTII